MFPERKLHYLDLKRKAAQLLERTTIPSETFNIHVKKLINDGILRKEDSGGRGKPVYYWLTPRAIKEHILCLY
ncbi:hypothetical protein NVIE_022300 [Nitrososphaera viennensis EN76]|uniref:HTH arsR-type domain-containing protein n=1 Tax=Nitrososphaera viennensis EN76 TaxID=926571 RepID=A0A060HMW9_9ARCH|nr:hypothetical protein NVIE_022300 [Nitrososphaera viennensis EN76]